MPALQHPPYRETADARTRRLGVELEFADVDCASAARILRRLYGGAFSWHDPYRVTVKDTELGDFTVELDMSYAHLEERPGEAEAERLVPPELEASIREAFGEVGGLWLPTEIACPPIDYTALPRLEPLIVELRSAGATGTFRGLLSAYGLQLNAEAARLDADYILSVLRAYLILSDWLRREIRVDLKRRITPFIDPFPRRYVERVMEPDYAPNMETLIDDYLAANPTRSRELDMLPLFAHLDKDRVLSRAGDTKIKARPAFHYRLPNSRIDEPGWSLTEEWNRWLKVEFLAADREKLDEARAAYLAHLTDFFSIDWSVKSARWSNVDG